MSCHYKNLPSYPGNALGCLSLKWPLIAAFIPRHNGISQSISTESITYFKKYWFDIGRLSRFLTYIIQKISSRYGKHIIYLYSNLHLNYSDFMRADVKWISGKWKFWRWGDNMILSRNFDVSTCFSLPNVLIDIIKYWNS